MKIVQDCEDSCKTVTLRWHHCEWTIFQADSVCGQDTAPGPVWRVGATAVHTAGPAEQNHPLHLLQAKRDNWCLYSWQWTCLWLQNGGYRLQQTQARTVKCSKECYLFEEEQWNVQKNAVCSRRNSEMFKRMLFIQGGMFKRMLFLQGETVKCSKECYLFKEEQWNV